MNKPGIIILGIALLTSGIGLSTQVLADPDDNMGYGRHYMGGDHMGYGRHHADDMPYHRDRSSKGSEWKKTLSDEQRKEIDKLKLAYKKQKYLLKSKIKQAKVELALLMTEDSPNKGAIDKKISEISKLKSEKMHAKVDHKIQVRKVLTPEQKVKFDMMLLKRAYSDRKPGHGHGHGSK